MNLYEKILIAPVYGNTNNKQNILKNNDGSSTEIITGGRTIGYNGTAAVIRGELSNGTNYDEVARYGTNRLENLDKCSLGKLGSLDDATVIEILGTLEDDDTVSTVKEIFETLKDDTINNIEDEKEREKYRNAVIRAIRARRAARGAFESFIYKRYSAMTALSPHAKYFLYTRKDLPPVPNFVVRRNAYKGKEYNSEVDGSRTTAYIKYDKVNYVECYYSSPEAYIAGQEPFLVCLCLDGRTGVQSILRRMEDGNYIDHGTIRPSEGQKPEGYDEYSKRYYSGSDVQELQAGGITADAVPFSVIERIIRESGFKDISEEMSREIEEIARDNKSEEELAHNTIPGDDEER